MEGVLYGSCFMSCMAAANSAYRDYCIRQGLLCIVSTGVGRLYQLAASRDCEEGAHELEQKCNSLADDFTRQPTTTQRHAPSSSPTAPRSQNQFHASQGCTNFAKTGSSSCLCRNDACTPVTALVMTGQSRFVALQGPVDTGSIIDS